MRHYAVAKKSHLPTVIGPVHKLIHYYEERLQLTDRWHGAIKEWPGNLSFAWGMLDPVANAKVLGGLRALRPAETASELPDLGHYPQVEDPAAMATVVRTALATSQFS